MSKRCKLPPDDIADWHDVLVSSDLDRYTLSTVIVKWIEEEISGNWYMRDTFISVSGYDYLIKVFSFQKEEDCMWFALRWT